MSESLIGGIGVILERGTDDSSGSVFAAIAGVERIEHSGLSATIRETTELNQQDKYARKKAIKFDSGQMRLTCQFLYATYSQLKTDFERGTPWAYRITLPDGNTTIFNFQAIVQNLPLSIDMNDGIMNNLTLELSGPMKSAQ